MMSVADVALHKGSDREMILMEGAKKVGQLTLYTSNSVVAGVVSQSFEKKYPFVKVSSWTAESRCSSGEFWKKIGPRAIWLT